MDFRHGGHTFSWDRKKSAGMFTASMFGGELLWVHIWLIYAKLPGLWYSFHGSDVNQRPAFTGRQRSRQRNKTLKLRPLPWLHVHRQRTPDPSGKLPLGKGTSANVNNVTHIRKGSFQSQKITEAIRKMPDVYLQNWPEEFVTETTGVMLLIFEILNQKVAGSKL